MNKYSVFILKEGEIAPYKLEQRIIQKDTVIDHYISKEGRITKGKYPMDWPITVLLEDDEVWMSSSLFEYEGIIQPIELARGKVLTSGLGIGFFPMLIRDKKEVKRVDIVECEEKVINLVYPQIQHPKFRIVHADIYHYLETTKVKYDFIYLDIWAAYLGPIREADKVTELAKRCLRPGGEVRVWLQELIDRVKGALPKKASGPTGPMGFYPPCLICGKTFRYEYGGLCMDCADLLRVSEIFVKDEQGE